MKIYHGSLEIVRNPEIRKPNRTLDYGEGFYTTTDYQQAVDWVMRHKNNAEVGYVNIYEVNLECIKKLNTLWFDEPTDEWIDFVDNNRNRHGFKHNYDFVYGPVANDRVYACFALYESGVFSKADLLRELKVYDLVDQLLFHTNAALEHIEFKEVKTIRLQ